MMNSLSYNLNDDQTHYFLRDKSAWENAIATYNGPDPLELWYNYICWYDYNIHIDPENKFRETLEKCLSIFEHVECYKQDIRIVKLWVKYIDLQPNPLNLYQLLYQRGIGTQCACFYISWAHYYDSANAFKQAESVYNLGFQAKSEPQAELHEAHTKFRLSISQRMLYNDSSSKKRSANNLCEQRQQITTLTPPPIKKQRNEDAGMNSQNPNQYSNYEHETNSCNIDNTRSSHDSYNNLKNSAYSMPTPSTYIFENQQEQQQHNTENHHYNVENHNHAINNQRYTENQNINDENQHYNQHQNHQNENQHYVANNSYSHARNVLENVKIGPNFARYARNNYEMWKPLLFLEEPYDENKRCMYQKHLIYPAGEENEYSPEEIRAAKWFKKKSDISETLCNPEDSTDENYEGTKDKKDYYLADLDEQIEASTIRFSMDADGETRNKTIKIKFRREVTSSNESFVVDTSQSTFQNYENYNEPHYKISSGKSHKYESKQKFKKIKKIKIVNNYDDPKYRNDFISSDYQNQSFKENAKEANKKLSKNEFDDASLLLSFANRNPGDADNGYVSNNDKKLQKRQSFSFNDEANSEFTTLPDHSNSSTPIRKSEQSSYSNSQSYKKYTSNASIQNDDSMCSYEQNSFFASEHDDDLKKRRYELALCKIEEHLNKSVIDPFNSELCKAFLTKLQMPSRENNLSYNIVNTPIQKISNTKNISLGDSNYNIEKEIGKGSYGSVYKAINCSTGNTVALKYQKPANIWELYICTEVHRRIKDSCILYGFMDITSATIAPNSSIFVTEYSAFGSLLDVNNKLRQATKKVMHESLVIHFTTQILDIVKYLHSCNIIHADIKPDNFLLMKIPNADSSTPSLRLIDFGCAIDMTLFPAGTQFRKVIQTDGFTCIEMQEGRPWSYQTDLFCVAGTVHVMLFGEYMQIVKKFDLWDIRQKLPRYLKKNAWTDFFSKMLNISDIKKLPNLNQIKDTLENECIRMDSELQTNIRTLSNILHRR